MNPPPRDPASGSQYGPDAHDAPTRVERVTGHHEDTRRFDAPSNAPIPSPAFEAVAAAGAQADSRIGTSVGPYVVERVLARGGMGVVYLAHDPGLRRKVAIKLMLKDQMGDEDAARRFQREARASAALSHANIASVFLVGTDGDGSPFMAMEFLSGGSLLDLIRKRTPVTFSQSADFMAQAAEGLRAAHKQGIIHRDIKPGNLMLTGDGSLKVVDFGLAKVMFDDTYRTVEGTVLGTPKYMSPEQGQGRNLDFRSDVYSLGASFYHLITGRPPFEAETSVQIMFKHASSPLVPMRSLIPTVPIEWDNVIARCMRKEPGDRYQSYEDLISDLRVVRLQTMAQETGPIIGADGAAPGPRASSPSLAMIPGPPSLREVSRVGTSVFGPAGGQSSGSSTQVSLGHAPRMPLAYKVAFGVGAVIVLLASVKIALMAEGGGDTPTGGASATGGSDGRHQGGMSVLFENIVEETGVRNRSSKPDPNYVSYRATVKIMEDLAYALRSYRIEHDAPGRLYDLVERGLVSTPMNISPESGEIYDGWGNPLMYSPFREEIQSIGLDGQANTGDDLVCDTSRMLHDVPPDYVVLDEEEAKRQTRDGGMRR